MATYRKIPETVEATQWDRNGDHPEDESHWIDDGPYKPEEKTEGKVVRFFCHPEVPGETECRVCCCRMREHGWIDQPNASQTVCPGDYIVTGEDGLYRVIRADIFEAAYELAEA